MIEIHQKCSKPHVESIAAKEKTKKKNFRFFQVHDCNIQIMVLLFSNLIDDGGGGGARSYWGESANAVPNSHKLCSRVSHIRGNRRLQLPLSAMGKSRPEGTALLITVSSEPGKYEEYGFVNHIKDSIHVTRLSVTADFFLDISKRHFAVSLSLFHIIEINKWHKTITIICTCMKWEKNKPIF